MDMMRKYIEYIVLFLFLLSCSSKVEILTGDSQYQPFAPDGIPFVVADSMWNVVCEVTIEQLYEFPI